MANARRRNVVPRRRRRDDEGEDESSTAGDLDDFSVSEGSAISNGDDEGDGEGSEVSGEERGTQAPDTDAKSQSEGAPAAAEPTRSSNKAIKSGTFRPTADTQAMLNGLKTTDTDAGSAEEIHFDTSGQASGEATTQGVASIPQSQGQQETLAQRSRREHMDYIRQRDSNPAFVPNRGGFFLHDDRSSTQTGPHGRPYQRGRGRGYTPGYGAGRASGQPLTGPADRQWSHDLHEAVNRAIPTAPANAIPSSGSQIPTAKPAAVAPNRTFSVSTVLGNVAVQVLMPGMDDKKLIGNVVKKQYTLLPQHRPPLRRDKPVRISIPDEPPSYIFPSTERSFIFIPRALRPNQQVYTRGRGRGSYHGSRRPSILGTSVYTPSVAMSRKSSFGAGPSTSGLHTPTDSGMSRNILAQNFNRPVVRMPVPVNMGLPPPPAMPLNMPPDTGMPEYGIPGPAILQSPPVALPMHQPRPQKAVSVAGIESPAFKPPQQQHEQPFHQQMPSGVGFNDGQATASAGPNVHIGTPLSHIPEGAIYAQPFQPYPMYPQPGYYGMPYAGAPMFYPQTSEAMSYSMNMGGPVLAPQFVPGAHPPQYGMPAQSSERTGQPGMVAHESNGMVFYYNPAQYQQDAATMGQYPIAPNAGAMGTSPSPYYYTMPSGVFYPPAG